MWKPGFTFVCSHILFLSNCCPSVCIPRFTYSEGGTTALVGGTRSPFFPPAGFWGFACPALVHLVSLTVIDFVGISELNKWHGGLAGQRAQISSLCVPG